MLDTLARHPRPEGAGRIRARGALELLLVLGFRAWRQGSARELRSEPPLLGLVEAAVELLPLPPLVLLPHARLEPQRDDGVRDQLRLDIHVQLGVTGEAGRVVHLGADGLGFRV